MQSLQISEDKLSRLAERAVALALDHWAKVDGLPAYPTTGGELTARLFSRPWAEEGLGGAVLDDFSAIAENARPSGGSFFGYVFGSGEPVGALGDLLASALNQNVTSWRSAPAAATIEQAVVGWLARRWAATGSRAACAAAVRRQT